MKIERINDNQIRCTLNSLDLTSRNLNLGELAYGSEKARSLFREMIQKASNEVGFDAEDIPLMVEAIPLSNESVMLVITKIEDPEELDSRFAKFAPASDDDLFSSSDFNNEYLEGAEDILDFLNLETETADSEAIESKSEPANKKVFGKISTRIYLFNSLDEVIAASNTIGQVYTGISTLYKKPETFHYYLVMKSDEMQADTFNRVCNILAEYGTKVKFEYTTEAYYQEHYELIIKGHALQSLYHL